MYHRIIDMHVHTDNSPDGNHSAMCICEKAELMGLRALAFTDHCEVDSYYEENYDKRTRQSYFEVSKAQSAFRGKVIVLKGIELAQPHYDEALSKKILSKYDYDVTIGSIHNLKNKQDFYFMENFTPECVKDLMNEYFDEIYNLIEWGNFDILAHLTYPLRYFYSKSGISVDINDYKKQVDNILSLLAKKEKALEVNTAGLRQPINKLSPELETIRRFRELGGEYVTFGSDAHFAEDISKGIDDAYDAMKKAGFSQFTFYQKHTPLQMPIE